MEYEQVLQDVIRRDHQDSTRSAAPLCQAEDAVLIDSTELSFVQTVDAIKQLIDRKIEQLSLTV